MSKVFCKNCVYYQHAWYLKAGKTKSYIFDEDKQVKSYNEICLRDPKESPYIETNAIEEKKGTKLIIENCHQVNKNNDCQTCKKARWWQ